MDVYLEAHPQVRKVTVRLSVESYHVLPYRRFEVTMLLV